MDKIHINGISCLAHLGVPPEERENPQEILVDVVLTLNLDKETVEERRFTLLETVAGQLCRAVLTDAQIKSVQIRVRKFPETLRDQVSYVEVEMTRQSG